MVTAPEPVSCAAHSRCYVQIVAKPDMHGGCWKIEYPIWVHMSCLKLVGVLRAQSDFTAVRLVPVGRATIQRNQVEKGHLVKKEWVKEVGRRRQRGDVPQCKEDRDQLDAVVNAKGSCRCAGKVIPLFWAGLGKRFQHGHCGVCKQMAKPLSPEQKRKFFVCK